MNKSQLDIVLPCYNPSGPWVEELIAAYDQLQQKLPQTDICFVLVNDGSANPPTNVDIDQLQQTLPNFLFLTYEMNQGKGHALRTGVKESNAHFCIYTDMDFPYRLEDVAALYHLLEAREGDIIIGVKNEAYYQHVPWSRIHISRFLRFLTRTFLQLSITDTQCGLKGFNPKGKQVFLQTTIDRYLCDLEFVFLADRKKEIKMIPIPIELREGVVFSKIGWRTLVVESMNFAGVFLRSFNS